MRQRNPFPYSVDLPTLDPPITVAGFGEIDHDELLGGFEPIDDDGEVATSDDDAAEHDEPAAEHDVDDAPAEPEPEAEAEAEAEPVDVPMTDPDIPARPAAAVNDVAAGKHAVDSPAAADAAKED